MIKLIFSDIDGTLINDHFKVSFRTQAAIKACVQQGIPFIPVSARMPEAIKPVISDFLPQTPMISYNGALIQDASGQALVSYPMTIATALAVCTDVENNSQTVVWNVYSGDKWLSQDRDNHWIQREEAIVGVTSKEANLASLGDLSEIHKILLMGQEEEIDQLESLLRERYPDLSIAKSLPTYLEIMAKGIQKGKAVAFLAQHYQVDLSETMAFGDNFNDLDMLKVVGHPYVMANAPEAVKKSIGHVTSDHNHDGIAEILEKLELFSKDKN